MAFDMKDYVDVAERIRLTMEKWPEASFQNMGTKVITIGQKYFVEVTVALFRDPQDVRPAIATAWEAIPGSTPYTRDSEMMNAETSAMGRAVIAAGIPSKKVASAEEVLARQSEPTVKWVSTTPTDDEPPFDPWATNERPMPTEPPSKKECKHGARKYWQSSKTGKELWFCPLDKNDPDVCAAVSE